MVFLLVVFCCLQLQPVCILSFQVISFCPVCCYQLKGMSQWNSGQTQPVCVLSSQVISFWPICSYQFKGMIQSDSRQNQPIFELSCSSDKEKTQPIFVLWFKVISCWLTSCYLLWRNGPKKRRMPELWLSPQGCMMQRWRDLGWRVSNFYRRAVLCEARAVSQS